MSNSDETSIAGKCELRWNRRPQIQLFLLSLTTEHANTYVPIEGRQRFTTTHMQSKKPARSFICVLEYRFSKESHCYSGQVWKSQWLSDNHLNAPSMYDQRITGICDGTYVTTDGIVLSNHSTLFSAGVDRIIWFISCSCCQVDCHISILIPNRNLQRIF